MKKLLAVLAVVCCIASLAACGASLAERMTGQVVTYGGEPLMMELACENGVNYGFVIGEDTELIWEDRSAFSVWGAVEDIDPWDVFGCGMYVTVVPGKETDSADEYVDRCVEKWYVAETITVTGVDENYFAVDDKPVIYLYPETTMEVEVKLSYQGRLICTYPAYADGWRVTARPDGTLTDESGLEYNYLYWEGITAAEYDFSEGFCVAGADTAAFLEEALARLGLNRREANEFIIYWLPRMEGNAYNLISFQQETYTENAALQVTPAPDTVLRVFMAWKPLEEAVGIPPQELEFTERTGFTVVEWGGSQVE